MPISTKDDGDAIVIFVRGRHTPVATAIRGNRTYDSPRDVMMIGGADLGRFDCYADTGSMPRSARHGLSRIDDQDMVLTAARPITASVCLN